MTVTDAFIHLSERTGAERRRLAADGVSLAVEPIRCRGVPWSHASSFRDHVATLVERETARSRRAGLDHRVLLGVPSGATTDLEVAMRCVEEIRPWLDHPAVVGVGALRMGEASPDAAEILKRHLDLAAEAHLPVLVLAEGEDAAARTMEIVGEMGFDPDGIALLGDDVLTAVREAGAWSAVPVGGRRSSPSDAVARIAFAGPERVLVGSAATEEDSNPGAVIRASLLLVDAGWPEERITDVLVSNTMAFYGRSGRLDRTR